LKKSQIIERVPQVPCKSHLTLALSPDKSSCQCYLHCILQIQPDDCCSWICVRHLAQKPHKCSKMIYQKGKHIGNGCVIANDADYSRAQMLIHQINQIWNCRSCCYQSYLDSFCRNFILIKLTISRTSSSLIKFLCDVPCSGDGATRKNSNQMGQTGIQVMVLFLHPLQLSILMKAVNLLKERWNVTCVFNLFPKST
jgi:hypothetical protein